MASGTWKGRITGRTHGRSDQHCADAQEILANVGPSTQRKPSPGCANRNARVLDAAPRPSLRRGDEVEIALQHG
ncbi:MAG: hypothetical protein WB610_02410, partial [Rhodomicrobium sp.]